ncbi:MAG: hypothetical protein JWP69_2280 [Flaviaesturariibacter sp.]|nr:hypothetical protein [Flaviaesturariibacter sp.]
MDTLFVIIISFLILAALSLYLYCIIHVHRNKAFTLKERSNWITLIVVFPLIGSFIYLFNKNRHKKASRLI